MSRARNLADFISSGSTPTGILADGVISYSEVTSTPTLGTAAALDVGTSANNIPQLDSNAKIPAQVIDGSTLTGIQGYSYASTLAFGDY